MESNEIILVGIKDIDIENLAWKLNKDIKETKILIIDCSEITNLQPTIMIDVLNQLIPAPRIDIKLESILQCESIHYIEKAYGNRSAKNYDRFLPKPIGMQRRKR